MSPYDASIKRLAYLPALIFVLAPWAFQGTACVRDEGTDASGGAGSTVASTSQSTGTGDQCFGILLPNACGVCLENKCCAELAACRAEPACIACLSDEDPACETNQRRTELRACEAAGCGDECLVGFGEPCAKNIECASQLCLPTGICSQTCTGPVDCPPGPEWTCDAGTCQCSASGDETCNGGDENCNGKIDDGAACGANEDCVEGACKCLFTVCSGDCIDPATDENHCSGCGLACGVGQLCCGSMCIDGQNDPFNCGSCGKNCLDGPCFEGKCEPVPLNPSGLMVAPTVMAIDGFNVFVADQDGLWGMATDGGFLEQLAEWQAFFARSMAVDDSSVYTTFASPGSIIQVPKFGGFTDTFATGTSLECVAVDFDAVYFTDYGAGLVKRAPLFGGSPTVLASEGPQKARACALSGAYLVYSTGLALNRVPVDGGQKTTLVNQPAFDVAVGIADIVYKGMDGVYRVGKNGGAATKLATESTADKVAVDDKYAYWITKNDVRRTLLKGGPIETLATMPGTLHAVAVDLTHVYWLEGDDAVVWKVAK